MRYMLALALGLLCSITQAQIEIKTEKAKKPHLSEKAQAKAAKAAAEA